MKRSILGAVALACVPIIAAAQQSGGLAYPDNWSGGAPLPAINQTHQPQAYGASQNLLPAATSDYMAVHNHRQDEQPHQHTYNAPQAENTPAHTRAQAVYERRPHHRPDSLVNYLPFISKAHADRDFKLNQIHVYGGN